MQEITSEKECFFIMTKRKDGRWQQLYTLPNGKRKYFYSSSTSERTAQREINRQIAEFEENNDPELVKFGKVAEEWNAEYRKKIPYINYNKNTRSKYINILDLYKNRRIGEITAIELNVFIDTLVRKGYSKKTIGYYKSIISMIFDYGILHGYIDNNPMKVIKLPNNLPKSVRELPSTDVLKAISQHHENDDLLPFFLLYTGLRKSEALAIKREDIDFEQKRIKVRWHVIHDGNRPVYEPVLKSEAAHRDVLLLDRLYQALPKNFKGFLFSQNNDGKEPLTKSEFERRIRVYKRTYQLNFTAHQLRHGYATMLYEAGIDEKEAQYLMGHSDIKLTHDIYTHIRDEQLHRTANKLNEFNF